MYFQQFSKLAIRSVLAIESQSHRKPKTYINSWNIRATLSEIEPWLFQYQFISMCFLDFILCDFEWLYETGNRDIAPSFKEFY